MNARNIVFKRNAWTCKSRHARWTFVKPVILLILGILTVKNIVWNNYELKFNSFLIIMYDMILVLFYKNYCKDLFKLKNKKDLKKKSI